MSAAPAVSIAIRAWRRDTVADAIASVLAQTWTDLELVFYDDAGTLADVAARFDDPRLRYVRPERKRGASGRWLAAVALCRGDYVGLLDDDDAYAPQFVEHLLAALRAYPQAGIASCRETSAALPVRVETPYTRIERNVPQRMIVERWGCATSTMLLRRTAIDDALRLQPMPDGVAPDLFMTFHVEAAGWQHVRVDAVLCRRNVGGARVTNSLTGARYALATFQHLRIDDDALERQRRLQVARRHIVLAGYLVMEGRRIEARAELQAARDSADVHRVQRSIVAVLARLPVVGPMLARTAWKVRLAIVGTEAPT